MTKKSALALQATMNTASLKDVTQEWQPRAVFEVIGLDASRSNWNKAACQTKGSNLDALAAAGSEAEASALYGEMKAVSLAGKLEAAVLAGGPVAQAGKGLKAVPLDAGGPEALPQAGERLEAVVRGPEGLQAVGEVTGCPGVARSAAAGGEGGLQAVLADAHRPRAAAGAAAAAAGTLQAVTLDTGRLARAAGAGLEAVGLEGAGAEAGAAAEAGGRAGAVGRGGGRLGPAAGGGGTRPWGLHRPHRPHAPV